MQKSYFFNFLCCFIFPFFLQAQLLVDNTSLSPEEMILSLGGAGVTISNVVWDCPEIAFGTFNCDNCNLGIEDGLVMTSGSINNTVGPNNSGGITEGLGTPGDPDLDQIPGVLGTNDACSVTFDFEVTADTLLFNYVFGSEEYLEFVGSFNDVFAFYIEGPDIAFQNIALIPGTTTPVSINNINDASNSAYYVDNGTGTTAPNNTDPYYIQYDGFTTVLEAKIAVTPCTTYSLKLVVADDLDSSLDSGVFIEAGSFQANGISVGTSTNFSDLGFENAIEGCVDAEVTFELDFPAPDTTIIYLDLGGTAIEGTDYPFFPDSITLLPGATFASVDISPYQDDITEGIEDIIVTISNTSGCVTESNSVTLLVEDNIVAIAAPSVINSCIGDEVLLLLQGGIDCTWQPGEFLSDSTSCFPTATVMGNIVYAGIASIGPCVDTAYVTINIDGSFNPQVGGPYAICEGQSIELNASGGTSYTWTPADYLSCSDCPNPTFNGLVDASYSVNIADNNGCNLDITVPVSVSNGDLGLISDTTTICLGDTYNPDVSITGGTAYAWSPAGSELSCSDCSSPTITATSSTTYSVTVTAGLCEQIITKTVLVNAPSVDAGSVAPVCGELSTVIGSESQAGNSYLWSPATGLSSDTIAQPTLNLIADGSVIETTYSVTMTDPDGCTVTDAVTVSVDIPRNLSIAPVDTIIQGSSTLLTVNGGIESDSYTWDPNNDLSAPNSSSTLASPAITTEYTATVMTNLGCESSASVIVYVIEPPRLLLPSAFSPNNDGVNDVLNLIHRDIAEVLSFQVYNRWGQLVYDSPLGLSDGWDGTFKGEAAELGVYVYYVRYKEIGNEGIKVLKGNVSIIR